jgi:predicted phage terminase large subunit-like protein
MARQVLLQVPAKLMPLLEVHKTFKVVHGGRGGGKSHTIAQLLLLKARSAKLRILCVREVQKSLKESSYQLLVDYIDKWGLRGEFHVTDKSIRHRLTGSIFTFAGLKDHTADSIKSFEGYDIVWAEEAHSIGEESWNKLIPTIIRKIGAEIWISFNPDDEEDYVYNRFVKHEDPEALVIQINFDENPWFSEAMDKERLADKRLNTDLYNWKWLGHCKTLAGKIFKRRWFKWYMPSELPSALSMYAASDYGASDDPEADYSEHGIVGLDVGGNWYFRDWWYEQADPDVVIKAMAALMTKHRPKVWGREKGVLLRAMGSAMKLLLRKLQAQTYMLDLPSAGSKGERALGFAALCAAGMVHLPLDKDGNKVEWAERLVNQLCGFTGKEGKQDDAVDVCSLLARSIEWMRNATNADESKDEPVRVGSRRHVEPRYRDEMREKREREDYYR